jgi:hypothetical protein
MSLDTLELGKNQFSFEDIEPNMSVSGKEFSYLIQDSIGVKKDTICNESTAISFVVNDNALYNNYQWYKDGILISSATTSTYSLTSLMQTDAGSYHCAITNSLVPNLTVYSRPVKLLVSALTGIERNTLSSIKIYPNPTNGFLNIESSEGFSNKATLEVMDCYGKAIYLKQLENTQNNVIDLSQLSKGIYLIRITDSDRYYYQKFVLQ